jgi:hypothetical protein
VSGDDTAPGVPPEKVYHIICDVSRCSILLEQFFFISRCLSPDTAT